MFAFVGQVERTSRGREGFQEIDVAEIDRPPRQVVGRADGRRHPRSRPPSRPCDQALNGPARSGRALARGGPPRRGGARRRCSAALAAVPPPRPTDDEVRDVLQLLAGAERPVILAGAGVLRARTSNDLVRLAELLRVPVVASWRRGDVDLERPPAVPRHDRLRLAADRPGAPRGARTRCS